ncbi:MAG TPA: ABC transporter ATP-binding protein [Nostocaceae cyanobacterium]|nr:ABC transporter ATP-binding protein [Nostocaceae cyanobacterium]
MIIDNRPHYKLQANNISVNYHGTNILDHIDLIIPPQQITVLVGANGCGKSTLLRCLARLLKPGSGTIYLNMTDILKLSTKDVAKRLGILTQSPVAPEGLTVRDLVVCGRYPYQTLLQKWTKEDELLVKAALEITNMQPLAERELITLSGGQKQRVWIAMALAQDPDILLLDEPTTYLDLAHQIEILDLLWELNKLQGKTLVMVLHDLNQACRYADYLIAIKEGKIYAQGIPEEIMTKTMVQDVFGIDCQISIDPVAGTPMCVPIGRKGKVNTGNRGGGLFS